MSSVTLFGEGGPKRTAAPSSQKPAQGLFGAKAARASAPLPRPEQFARV